MGGCSSSGAGSYGYATYKVNPTLAAAALRVTNQLCRDRLELSLCAPDIKEFTIFQTVEESDIEDIMRLALNFDAKTLQATGVYNKFALKPGQWTDDTSMGLCLADSLLVCGGYDGSDIRLRFWNWWNRGYNNTFRLDEERSASVGLGGNVSLSLLVMTQSRDQDLKPRFEGLGDDAGNGSVMRLAPVPIYFHSDLDLAIRASAESSYTTHPGPSAADACAFLGFLICRAIRRDSRRMTAAQFLDDAAAAYLARPEVESQRRRGPLHQLPRRRRLHGRDLRADCGRFLRGGHYRCQARVAAQAVGCRSDRSPRGASVCAWERAFRGGERHCETENLGSAGLGQKQAD
eukprot:CAMPEP_0115244612 /NCGR_PEP_ID=MMETSP0270-20121206/40074_1 /TAXON_ID=71861 /ORGANISM="Scrippsiella trochoidea, Strain CCMP3099" /LENGTH=346 /DNA_ID=CAMNT_0002659747 /DNA_START=60 /DNA_END=1098 /DNA_ORIENTATION=-